MLLHCFVQHYHWGKKGKSSEVAQLVQGNRPDFIVEENKPYAELWMGTHRSCPSVIIPNGLLLIDWLYKNPSLLGAEVQKRFGSQLPFLFKVLSVDTALSIQAHPSKTHAEELHAMNPNIYPDPNHKPEMAVALTEFKILCGFRPIDEIKKFLQDVEELRSVIGDELVENFLASDEADLQNAFRALFRGLMTAPPETVSNALDQLLSRLKTLDEAARQDVLGDLIEQLHSQYPGDVGVFGPYVFNYMVLNPGEAVYLAANEPHAYISGDCVECMACSDNVVRAGLTPKLKDVETLCQMLTYICEPASNKLYNGFDEDAYTTTFKPPVPDFFIAKITIPRNKDYYLIPRRSASICIVIRGNGKVDGKFIQRGSIFFLIAAQTSLLEVFNDDFLLFQAAANV